MLNAFLMQMRDTALIMGIIALVGLLLQKKSAVERLPAPSRPSSAS